MNKCAVDGVPIMGTRREYASSLAKALARAYGLPVKVRTGFVGRVFP